MKKYFIIWAILCLAVAVIPLRIFGFPDEVSEKDNDGIKIYNAAEDRTEEMSMRDYLICVTGAEMPAVYDKEALKAQALCSKTLVMYLKQNSSGKDMPDGAEVSTDPAKHQAFLSREQMEEKWGDEFDVYYEKLSSAVDEILDETIVYDGKVIMAAFHAISPGKTEAAENVWSGAVPYLVSVDSDWDRDAEKFSSSLSVSAEEFCEKLGLKKKKSNIISDIVTSDVGTVISMKAGKKTFSGTEVRNAFGLRSAVFTVSFVNGVYTFDVKGYGHGVGMSQYGANVLAEKGYTYKEIIEYYYPGTEISEGEVG